MITDPFVFKVLDISTGHMTKDDSLGLDANSHSGPAPVYELHEYGWLVYVGEIEESWPGEDWSEAFRKVLNAAKELGCDYVRFDRDGREYPELQKFEW